MTVRYLDRNASVSSVEQASILHGNLLCIGGITGLPILKILPTETLLTEGE